MTNRYTYIVTFIQRSNKELHCSNNPPVDLCPETPTPRIHFRPIPDKSLFLIIPVCTGLTVIPFSFGLPFPAFNGFPARNEHPVTSQHHLEVQ